MCAGVSVCGTAQRRGKRLSSGACASAASVSTSARQASPDRNGLSDGVGGVSIKESAKDLCRDIERVIVTIIW